MATKLLTLVSIVSLAGVCAMSAQSPTPSGSPATSPSTAKHSTQKKAQTSPSPAAESMASASPAKQRARKKSEASPSPAPTGTASASPAHRGRKKAETSPSPAASATPQNPISAVGSLFKPKSSPTPKSATRAATNATPAPGGGHGLVWVNTESHVYHKEGSRFYGTTKKGKYMTEADAVKEGDRAAKAGE